MSEVSTPQPPPPATEAVSTPVDDLDQNFEIPETPLEPTTEAEDQPETTEVTENEETEEQTGKKAGLKEIKRQQALREGIKPIYNLAESDEFADQEILAHLGPWIEKYGAEPENISEILKYFELAKEIISPEFPADRRVEVVCAFAEVIAEGHLDAESLASLVSEIIPAKEAAEGQAEKDGYEGVAFFQNADGHRGTRIILLEKFFQQKEDGNRAYDIAHMLKHEIGHGLVRYGELLTADEMEAIVRKTKNLEQQENQEAPRISAEIRDILDQARKDQHLQTKHLATVLRALNELRQKPGVTEAQIQQREIMAANQIMAEKIGIFLSSNGEFGDFLRANIEVTSDDNLHNIFGRTGRAEIREIINKVVSTDGEEQQVQIAELQHECPELSRFLESNKVFFDLVSERLRDKEQLKEKINHNIRNNNVEIGGYDEVFYDYYKDGFYEPFTAIESSTQKNRELREKWSNLAIGLAEALGNEVGQTLPVSALTESR